MGIHVEDGQLDPVGTEVIANLAAATALTIPTGARLALITVEGQNVRWWPTGNPTTAQGHLLTPNDAGLWLTSRLSTARFIEVTAGASAQVSYYK